MRRDERHEGMPRMDRESMEDVLRDVRRVLSRQARGEPADCVESADLLRRLRRLR